MTMEENEEEALVMLNGDIIDHHIISTSSVCTWAAAPEVYGLLSKDDTNKYRAKADIWLVGITALELAYGGLKLRGRDDLEHLIMCMHRMRRLPSKLNPDRRRCWEKEKRKDGLRLISCLGHSTKRTTTTGFVYRPKERAFSQKLVDLVLVCLDPDPTKRPTATQLLELSIFDRVRDMSRFNLDVLREKDNPKTKQILHSYLI